MCTHDIDHFEVKLLAHSAAWKHCTRKIHECKIPKGKTPSDVRIPERYFAEVTGRNRRPKIFLAISIRTPHQPSGTLLCVDANAHRSRFVVVVKSDGENLHALPPDLMQGTSKHKI